MSHSQYWSFLAINEWITRLRLLPLEIMAGAVACRLTNIHWHDFWFDFSQEEKIKL